jgi:hypothetical protein
MMYWTDHIPEIHPILIWVHVMNWLSVTGVISLSITSWLESNRVPVISGSPMLGWDKVARKIENWSAAEEETCLARQVINLSMRSLEVRAFCYVSKSFGLSIENVTAEQSEAEHRVAYFLDSGQDFIRFVRFAEWTPLKHSFQIPEKLEV